MKEKKSQNILAILVLAISISLTMTTLPISVYASIDADGRDNGSPPPDNGGTTGNGGTGNGGNGDDMDNGGNGGTGGDTDNGGTDDSNGGTGNGGNGGTTNGGTGGDTDNGGNGGTTNGGTTNGETGDTDCPDGRPFVNGECPEPEEPEPTDCPDGRDPVGGVCPLPEPGDDMDNGNGNGNQTNGDDMDNGNGNGNQTNGNGNGNGNQTNGDTNGNQTNGNGNGNDTSDVDVDINVIINDIQKHDHDKIQKDSRTSDRSSFPEVDIIGISAEDDGDAMYCLMNIDDDHVQCEEFEMSGDRVDQDISKIIELDTDKEYDDGNTGSDVVDDAIDAVNNQDFDELEDLDNHEFDIQLTSIGINSNGDGLTCILEDDSDEGKAFCESFTVSNDATDGQITELIEFD